MATDQLINKSQGDAIISGLTAIKNAINDQPVPTQVEDVVADAFDVGVSYVPGDYCIHENKLYICDVAHHGAWDGNDFTLTNVGAELDTLNEALSNISKIDKGKYNGTWNSAQTKFTIVFNKTFSSVPTFVYSVRNKTSNTNMATWLESISQTSASVIVYGSISVNQSLEINWIAIE